jgi:hypothetical protein
MAARARTRRRHVLVALASVVAAAASSASPPSTAADAVAGGRLVSEVAAPGTPHVLNGQVRSVVQVGNTVILGGTFTRARNDGSSVVLTRNRLLAFDATTGQISTSFRPSANDAVNVLLPSGDGRTVFVGGWFTTIGGVARQRLARISVGDGSVVRAFQPRSVDGQVRDLRLSAGRLWVAGAFTHIGGRRQRALATLQPVTGAAQGFMRLRIDGTHRRGRGHTEVLKIDITPAGRRLVAIGNFHTLNRVVHHQLLMLRIGGRAARPAAFRTKFYTSRCSSSVDTYMRDVDFSPDGAFFVVGTTGAYTGSTSACDTVARFETKARGVDVRPSWVDYSGGDTTTAVDVAPGVVYVGGHERWWNNPFARNRAGPGAVSRQGLAALSPVNGLPFTWDPTRTRGAGVFDFLMTGQGLWIASDTDRIGSYQYKGRIARMPRDGVTFAALSTPGLPGIVYAATGSRLTHRAFSGATAGTPRPSPTGGVDWASVRGAFMLNGWLYLAHGNGAFTKRTFNGTSYGPPVAVSTQDRIVGLAAWHSDIRSMTGLFYDRGRIYFTRSGSSALYYRYFNPQSDIVGAVRLRVSAVPSSFKPALVRGMFTSGRHIYWSRSDGVLRRLAWAQNHQSGHPAGTAARVSGPGIDGQSWSARSLFLAQWG